MMYLSNTCGIYIYVYMARHMFFNETKYVPKEHEWLMKDYLASSVGFCDRKNMDFGVPNSQLQIGRIEKW